VSRQVPGASSSQRWLLVAMPWALIAQRHIAYSMKKPIAGASTNQNETET